MRHPAARWVLFVVAVAVAGGLGYRAVQVEQQTVTARARLTAATRDAQALQQSLSDARRAMAAMASPGQPAASYSRQVSAAVDAARTRLTALAAMPGGEPLSASTARLDQLVEAESRLHEYAVSGRSLMASDVTFGEALPHLDAVATQVADVTTQWTAAAERDAAAVRQQQSMMAAGAAGVLALAALILAPLPRRTEAAATAVSEPVDEKPAGDLSLDLGRVVPDAAPVPRPAAAVPTLDLAPLAAVCGELAKLADGAALTSVLERVGPAIGAKGLVVWLADAERSALQPAAAWGYDPRLVARFPAVQVSDDNPTARAFSRKTTSVAAGRGGEAAAVAAPIVNAQGAVGVLSVELAASGAPASSATAAAGIVAAQLATLLEPLPAPAAAGDDDAIAEAQG